MKTKLDIKAIQTLNLFEKINKIKAVHCFSYNNAIIFTVKPFDIKRIRIPQLKFLSKQLGSRIRVMISPKEKSLKELCRFLNFLAPAAYKKISLDGQELLLVIPSTRAKAIFMGREKIKLKQLTNLLERFFGIKKVCVR